MGCSSAPVAATVGDRTLMMQHAVYIHLDPVGDASSVISGSPHHQLSSGEALHLGLVDEVLPEPPGAAHRDAAATFPVLRTAIAHHLKELEELEEGSLVRQRRKRLQVGFVENRYTPRQQRRARIPPPPFRGKFPPSFLNPTPGGVLAKHVLSWLAEHCVASGLCSAWASCASTRTTWQRWPSATRANRTPLRSGWRSCWVGRPAAPRRAKRRTESRRTLRGERSSLHSKRCE